MHMHSFQNNSNRKVLLLNASNMETFPVYPYAFIQVSAIAREAGIEIICKDLLGAPKKKWEHTIRTLIEDHDPAMILITLRNTDSLTLKDYNAGPKARDGRIAYFPIERTKELIAAVRAVTALKITLGGFGFSLLSNEIMSYLRADYGVFGGPDGFFAHFEAVLAGNLSEVPNLLYFQDNHLISNPRIFYPPSVNTEYTAQAIAEMMAFYTSYPTPGFNGAPVEIIRGCPHSCIFCAEPHVEGKQVRYRNLSAVMADVQILVDHGITKIYMISSELNPEGNEFILELADRIRSFNQEQESSTKVTWFGANYLLNFNADEYERLYQSGFTGGWFDITALDDKNARAMQTPYRNKSVINHLKIYAQVEMARRDSAQKQETSNSEKTAAETDAERQDSAARWSMFLGNPATSIETIRTTLRVANQEGIAQQFGDCSIISCTRVFDYEQPDEATLAVTDSFSPHLQPTSYRQILPSFAYPPALLQVYGSGEEILQLFNHIAETYLSTKYQKSRNWYLFIKAETDLKSLSGWMDALPALKDTLASSQVRSFSAPLTAAAMQQLFSERSPGENDPALEKQAKEAVKALMWTGIKTFPEVFAALGFPSTTEELERTTPYDLAVAIFRRWDTDTEIWHALSEIISPLDIKPLYDFISFCVWAILYRNNIWVDSKYSALFIEDAGKQ